MYLRNHSKKNIGEDLGPARTCPSLDFLRLKLTAKVSSSEKFNKIFIQGAISPQSDMATTKINTTATGSN